MESATLSEEQFQYRHAEGYWIAVADLAERLGRIDTARHALERVRQINLLTGGASHQADVMAASISGEPAGVLGAAFAWTQSVKATFVDRPVLPHLDDDTIHGTVGNIPAIFHILVHVARALAAIGQTQQACDLAHSVPHLLETSNYPRWKERRELERWSDLLDNCPTEPPAEFTQLELEDLLDFVIDQTRPFASHRSNPTSEDRLSPR